jgi:N-glycosidase YbiA
MSRPNLEGDYLTCFLKMGDGSPILFYRTGDEFGCFSNFSKHPVTAGGSFYPTSEHFFQSCKYYDKDEDYAEVIRKAPSASEAARLGRDKSHPIREDWDKIRDDVMSGVLWVKAWQNPEVRQALVKSGNRHIVEHTAKDGYWGDAGDGSGKNMLGKLWMEVRDVCSINPYGIDLSRAVCDLCFFTNMLKSHRMTFEQYREIEIIADEFDKTVIGSELSLLKLAQVLGVDEAAKAIGIGVALGQITQVFEKSVKN